MSSQNAYDVASRELKALVKRHLRTTSGKIILENNERRIAVVRLRDGRVQLTDTTLLGVTHGTSTTAQVRQVTSYTWGLLGSRPTVELHHLCSNSDTREVSRTKFMIVSPYPTGRAEMREALLESTATLHELSMILSGNRVASSVA